MATFEEKLAAVRSQQSRPSFDDRLNAARNGVGASADPAGYGPGSVSERAKQNLAKIKAGEDWPKSEEKESVLNRMIRGPYDQAIGIANSAIGTGYGLGRLTGLVDENADLEAAVQGENPTQRFAKTTGDIAQFFVPGGAVTKAQAGLKGVVGTGKIGSVAATLAPQAVSDALVATAQTGDVKRGAIEGVVSAGFGGAVGGIGGAVSRMRSKAVNSDLLKSAEKFGIDLTAGEASKNPLIQSAERILRRGLASADVFRNKDDIALTQVEMAAARIADGISAEKLSPSQAGAAVGKFMADAKKTAGSLYNSVVEAIVADGGELIPIPLDDMAVVAQELLAKLESPLRVIPQLAKEESIQLALPALRNLAKKTETKMIPIPLPTNAAEAQAFYRLPESVRNSGEIATEVPRTISVIEARDVRQLLRSLTDKGKIDMGKGAITQITKAIDSAMKQGLDNAGLGYLARDFDRVSTHYRKTSELLEQATLETIQKTVEKGDPASIADILLRNAPEVAPESLRKLLNNSGKMKVVERSVWDEIVRDATTEGAFSGTKLNRTLTELDGSGALATIFPDTARRADMLEFGALASELQKMKTPRSGETMMANIQGWMVTGAAGGIGYGMLTGDSGKMYIGAGTITTVVLGPRVLARILSHSDGPKLLLRAARTPKGTKEAATIYGRLVALSGTQAARE